MSKISLVIPGYNESLRLKEPLESALKYFSGKKEPFEIIYSDDGSTDDTVKKIEALRSHYPNVRLLQNPHRGKAGTVKSGVEISTGDLILMMDADSAVAIDELEKLKKKMEATQADIVIGSREGLGAQRVGEPFYRHLLGRVFNFIVKILTGLKFEDTQCGFKLFKTVVAKTLAHKSKIMNQEIPGLTDPLVTAFDVELLVLAKKFGYKVIEVPIFWRHVPTLNINPIRDSLRMFFDVLLIQLNLLTGKYN